MSLSAKIVPHLRSLRRFSSALSGSKTSGDALLGVMLEALIADTSIFPRASSTRVALYNLLSKFSSFGTNTALEWNPASAGDLHTPVDVMLLAPMPRQALLLVAVEDFSATEAAEVLGVSEKQFGELLMCAYADILSMPASFEESRVSQSTRLNATRGEDYGTDDKCMVVSELDCPAMARL